MAIRVASQNDVPEIAGLVASLAHYYLDNTAVELPQWFCNTLTLDAFGERMASAEYLNLVFIEGGIVAGYLSLKSANHLYHLFVDKKSQRKGIARLLMHAALERSSSDMVFLRSSLFAVPVYKKLGFVETGPVGCREGISFQPMELHRKRYQI